MFSSYLVLLATSICCSLLGVFLVLRNISMITDAIAHSVLLGIVVAFFIVHDLHSPWLIICAGIFGVLAVASIETLGKGGRIMKNDAVGVVFPIFFSLAVILISRYAKNTHLDTDIVLMGEVIFASLDTVQWLNLNIPVHLLRILLLLLINLVFIHLLYRWLKISGFDEQYARLIGLPVTLIFYSLMILTSITAVTAFDAVGSILVISFFITPAASAYLIAKNLKGMLLGTVFFSIINCSIGVLLAIYLNASMTGLCAFVGTVVFCLVLLGHKNGVITRYIQSRKIYTNIRQDVFIIHLGNHILDNTHETENHIEHICHHLTWPQEEILKIANILLESNMISIQSMQYTLKPKGWKRYNHLHRIGRVNRPDTKMTLNTTHISPS